MKFKQKTILVWLSLINLSRSLVMERMSSLISTGISLFNISMLVFRILIICYRLMEVKYVLLNDLVYCFVHMRSTGYFVFKYLISRTGFKYLFF